MRPNPTFLIWQLSDVLDSSEPQLATGGGRRLPERRLLGLLGQAVAYQMDCVQHNPVGGKAQVEGR